MGGLSTPLLENIKLGTYFWVFVTLRRYLEPPNNKDDLTIAQCAPTGIILGIHSNLILIPNNYLYSQNI